MIARRIIATAAWAVFATAGVLWGQATSAPSDKSALTGKPTSTSTRPQDPAAADPKRTVLVEAESFQDLGGWVVDQQFMDQTGSPFLLAHGLGRPVRDATTTVAFPARGTYRIWVRTRDWVAPWKASGAPGKFQLMIEGKPLKAAFGTEGAAWHWQPGGTVRIPGRQAKIALHDLTGFEGRCDALLFSLDELAPPNRDPEMAVFRRRLLGMPRRPEDGNPFDLVVVGGGMAGTCAALSAARLGLTVALVQDRPVLGGNNSSEVRVWLQGARNLAPWPRVGDVVAELEQKDHQEIGPTEIYEDQRRLDLVRAEKNITLLVGWRVNQVETLSRSITGVIAQEVTSGRCRRLVGSMYADCTGDATVGFLAGADYEITAVGHMGNTNLWSVVDTGKPTPFPHCPWAFDLGKRPFPDDVSLLGKWFWESGFNRDPFTDGERIRDTNFRAMYGAWDALKNVRKKYPSYRLDWAAYIAGKRESRRLLGDLVLSKDDLIGGRAYTDGCVPTGWSIDLHLPAKKYAKGFEEDPFLSAPHFTQCQQPYWVPYRCLYSRDVTNLLMAGRDISVTHEALGAVRVMRTCGMMGEIVGMAASLCKKHQTPPRGVYETYLNELKALMAHGVGKIHADAEKGRIP
jgi:hypothetical protein